MANTVELKLTAPLHFLSDKDKIKEVVEQYLSKTQEDFKDYPQTQGTMILAVEGTFEDVRDNMRYVLVRHHKNGVPQQLDFRTGVLILFDCRVTVYREGENFVLVWSFKEVTK